MNSWDSLKTGFFKSHQRHKRFHLEQPVIICFPIRVKNAKDRALTINCNWPCFIVLTSLYLSVLVHAYIQGLVFVTIQYVLEFYKKLTREQSVC